MKKFKEKILIMQTNLVHKIIVPFLNGHYSTDKSTFCIFVSEFHGTIVQLQFYILLISMKLNENVTFQRKNIFLLFLKFDLSFNLDNFVCSHAVKELILLQFPWVRVNLNNCRRFSPLCTYNNGRHFKQTCIKTYKNAFTRRGTVAVKVW